MGSPPLFRFYWFHYNISLGIEVGLGAATYGDDWKGHFERTILGLDFDLLVCGISIVIPLWRNKI